MKKSSTNNHCFIMPESAGYEGDLEAAGKMVKAALTKKPPKKRKKRTGNSANKKPVDEIVAEMKGLGIGTSDLSIVYQPIGSSEMVEVPPMSVFSLARELKWTANLAGFQEAKQSGIDAIMRLHAETQGLCCSFNAESPNIEQTLFQIRAGIIGSGDSRITQLVSYAQSIGKGRIIHRRIDDALHDAERRKNDGTCLPDLNKFRLTVAVFWTGFLFWLMSDDNIAAFMHANGMVEPSFICNPSSITKIRKQLRLIKSSRLLVKAVGPNFHWTFASGYPSKDQ